MSKSRGLAIELGLVLLAIAGAFLVGAILIAARGHSPIEVYQIWFAEALGTPGGRSQVAFKSTTLIFTGLAAAFAFEAGFFNIGAEGQIYVGAFTAALLALALPPSLPALVAIPLITLAAAGGGALAGLLPGVLRAYRHTHEVITAMMMNFILTSVVNWLLGYARESAEVVRTRPIPAAWRLTRLERGFDGTTAVIFGIAVAVATWYFFQRTRRGYELRVLGRSPGAAEFGGMSPARLTTLTFLLAGGLAGLGGVNFVLGSPGYFEQHFAPGQGFLGIAVALLARAEPLAVPLAAFLFATMAEGSQAIQTYVPPELGNILEAFMVVFVIGAARLHEWIQLRPARTEAAR